MNLKVLGSSSNGNSYILESSTGSLLIEAGIPWKEILKGLDYDISKVVGCLITHEHKDHSKALGDIMSAGIDSYYSEGTAYETRIESHRTKFIKSKDNFTIGDFNIMAFDTEHDAREPLGYLIHYKPTGEKLLFLTDSFYCKYKFQGLNYIMIESNYIKETLDKNIADGFIDEAMKPRLLQSHFSLENVKKFLQANDLKDCRQIVLLHLSERNASAPIMIEEIEALTGIKTIVADKGVEINLELYPY